MKKEFALIFVAAAVLFACTPDAENASTTTTTTTVAGNAADRIFVLLNELDADGDPADFIELVNTNLSAAVTLEGGRWFLTDHSGDLEQCEIAQTTIPAGGVVFFEKDAVGSFTFGLGSDETVSLSYKMVDGSVVVIDSYTYTGKPHSIGRYPEGGEWTNCNPTPGTGNEVFVPSADDAARVNLLINEFDTQGDVEDFIEIINTNGSVTVTIPANKYYLSDMDSDLTNQYAIPETNLAPGEFLLFANGVTDINGTNCLDMDMGLGSDEAVGLFYLLESGDYDTLDFYDYDTHQHSLGRDPSDLTTWAACNPTPGYANILQ